MAMRPLAGQRSQGTGSTHSHGVSARRKGNKMMQRIRKLMAHEGGFTLIELLIVIVILGILAAIVVFAVSGITNRGVLSACKSDKKSVEVAVEAFYAKTGAYPAGGTDATRITQLTVSPNQFLRSSPSSPDYTITLGDGTGVVGTSGLSAAAAGC